MKLLLALLLIALCILSVTIPGHAAITGTVTLANIRLSLVNGTAFVDLSAAGTLTPYIGYKLTLTDSAGKKAIGYIKAAGTGETLGSDLWDAAAAAFTSGTYSWTKYSNNTIENDSNTLKTTYVDNAYGAYNYLRDASDLNSDLSVGGLYVFAGDFSVNAGSAVQVRLSLGGSSYVTIGTPVSETPTTMSNYFIATNATTNYVKFNALGAGEIVYTDNLSLKQVTAPSATGVTITSTPNGSTYNWASIEAGFNYNDASGYSYTITGVGSIRLLTGVGR